MSMDRARVVGVIVAVRETIVTDRANRGAGLPDPDLDVVVPRVCAAHGVCVEEWRAAIAADPELGRLFVASMDELVVDTPDPGPYDTISRESARGAPDPTPAAFDRDARLLNRS